MSVIEKVFHIADKGGEKEMNRSTSMDPPMKQDDVYLYFKKI